MWAVTRRADGSLTGIGEIGERGNDFVRMLSPEQRMLATFAKPRQITQPVLRATRARPG
jgi:hypothetical protein